MIDTQTLIDCTGAARADAQRYTLHLADGMNRFGIHSVSAMAVFLGQLAIESDALQKVEENLNYTTPARLREIFPSLFVKGGYRAEEYVRNPREALEPAHAQGALMRGAHHTLHQLAPYLGREQRRHLLTLSHAYNEDAAGNGSNATSPVDMAV